MTCLASELTLKEGAPTVAIQQAMATMQRLQAWRLICVLWFVFCENQTIEPQCPLHLNNVSTNSLHTYNNILFLRVWARSPQRYALYSKNVCVFFNLCAQLLP